MKTSTTSTKVGNTPEFICHYPGCKYAMSGKPLSNRRYFEKHLTTHNPYRLKVLCEDCGRSFSRPDSLKRHRTQNSCPPTPAAQAGSLSVTPHRKDASRRRRRREHTLPREEASTSSAGPSTGPAPPATPPMVFFPPPILLETREPLPFPLVDGYSSGIWDRAESLNMSGGHQQDPTFAYEDPLMTWEPFFGRMDAPPEFEFQEKSVVSVEIAESVSWSG